MKRITFLILTIVALSNIASAQDKLFTKTGSISFYSSTAMEDIEAHNNMATCVLNKSTGEMKFAVLMTGFEFQKSLMEEHFNENYVESDKYPKSTFDGKVNNISSINFSKDGTYEADISGNLTIHGVTKPVNTKGKFIVNGGKVTGTSEFNVLIADYNISVPSINKDNVSKSIKITVNVALDPYVQ